MIAINALAPVQAYIDGILDGSIVACESVRGAVARHCRDLERQESKDFPFYFSATAASAAIDFFPAMLKHSIGSAAGMVFHLEPWQAFAVASIYGWKQCEDKCRRFRRVYWSMGRKNGKSTIGAGLAILGATADYNPLTSTPEQVPEIYLCATKKEQAEVIYREVVRMRDKSKWIKGRSTVKLNRFNATQTQGYVKALGSDRSFDGLNPHMIIMDEIHAWTETHRNFYDTMLTAVGNRAQPLILSVTTAGDNKSEIWKAEHKYAAGVARGQIEDERFFSYSFELDEGDDPLDEANWLKANPNIGVSLKLDFLRDQVKPAKTDPIAFRRFERYHANRMVGSSAGAFDLNQWDACKGELSDWQMADVVTAGVDLGARDDLAAWALVARFDTEQTNDEGRPVYRYEIKTRSYIASDTRRDLTKQPFAGWVYNDLIVVDKYPLKQLERDLVEECHENRAIDLAYDPYNGQPFAESLDQQGIVCASYSQTCGMFHEPICELRQAMADGRLRHDGNPLLRWCVGNAVLDADPQDRFRYTKRDSSEKIDPVVAMTMAYRLAMIAPSRATGNLFTYGSKR